MPKDKHTLKLDDRFRLENLCAVYGTRRIRQELRRIEAGDRPDTGAHQQAADETDARLELTRAAEAELARGGSHR